MWIKPPGWRPVDVAARFPKPAFDIQRERYHPPLTAALVIYGVVQFALLLGMGVHFLDLAKRLPASGLLAYAGFLLLSLGALGVLLEGRRTGFWLELLRLLATAIVALAMGGWFAVAQPGIGFAMAAVYLLSAVALVLARRPLSRTSNEMPRAL